MVAPYAFLHLQIVDGNLKLRTSCQATHSAGDFSKLGFMITPETEITVTKEKKGYRSQPHNDYNICLRDVTTGDTISITVEYLPGRGFGKGSVRRCTSWDRRRLLMNIDKCIVVFDKESIELNFYQTPWPRPAMIKKCEESDLFNKYLKNDKAILRTLKYLRLDATKL